MNLPPELQAIWISYLDSYIILDLLKTDQQIENIFRNYSSILPLIFFDGKKNHNMIECDRFNINKFSFSDIQFNIDEKYKTKQHITFLRYNYGTTTIPIKFVRYGIRYIDSDFIKSDRDREYFRIPYDKSQLACVELFKMFETIDEYIVKNQHKLLKKLPGKYVYNPIVRFGDISQRPGYAKIKIMCDYTSNNVQTLMFDRLNFVPKLIENIKTISDMTYYFTSMSTCQFIISGSKMWIDKVNGYDGYRRFGVSFKCQQIDIIDKLYRKRNFEEYAF